MVAKFLTRILLDDRVVVARVLEVLLALLDDRDVGLEDLAHQRGGVGDVEPGDLLPDLPLPGEEVAWADGGPPFVDGHRVGLAVFQDGPDILFEAVHQGLGLLAVGVPPVAQAVVSGLLQLGEHLLEQLLPIGVETVEQIHHLVEDVLLETRGAHPLLHQLASVIDVFHDSIVRASRASDGRKSGRTRETPVSSGDTRPRAPSPFHHVGPADLDKPQQTALIAGCVSTAPPRRLPVTGPTGPSRIQLRVLGHSRRGAPHRMDGQWVAWLWARAASSGATMAPRLSLPVIRRSSALPSRPSTRFRAGPDFLRGFHRWFLRSYASPSC